MPFFHIAYYLPLPSPPPSPPASDGSSFSYVRQKICCGVRASWSRISISRKSISQIYSSRDRYARLSGQTVSFFFTRAKTGKEREDRKKQPGKGDAADSHLQRIRYALSTDRLSREITRNRRRDRRRDSPVYGKPQNSDSKTTGNGRCAVKSSVGPCDVSRRPCSREVYRPQLHVLRPAFLNASAVLRNIVQDSCSSIRFASSQRRGYRSHVILNLIREIIVSSLVQKV